jgi:hypothetical protein
MEIDQAADQVINNFMVVNSTTQESNDFLKTQFELFRVFLNETVQDRNLISFRAYNAELDFDLLIEEKQKNNIVIVLYDGEYLMPMLVDSNKIKSFVTMNKGVKKTFITF